MLSRLVVGASGIASSGSGGVCLGRAAGLSTLCTSLRGIDLAVGKLAGSNASVWLAVLTETVMLCNRKTRVSIIRVGAGEAVAIRVALENGI